MLDPRKERFAPYLRKLADLLCLKDWAVKIGDGTPANLDANASITVTYGRKHATVWLSESYLGNSPEDQRHTAVHELIHCHLDSPYEIAREAIPEASWPPFRRMAEHAVDGLADAIAPLLPLPDPAE